MAFLGRLELKGGWMNGTRVRGAFLLGVGAPVLWLPLCYGLWVRKGCHYTPFISDLDLYAPEEHFFTFGLTLTGLAILVMVFDLFFLRRAAFEKAELEKHWNWLNVLAILPGIGVSMGCVSLAFTPWNQDLMTHVHQSDAIFYGGVLWCALATAGTWRMGRESPRFRRILPWRLAGVLGAGICLAGMAHHAAQYFFAPEFDLDDLLARTKDMAVFCSAMGSPVLVKAALFEWGLVFFLLCTLGTFWPELQGEEHLG